MATEGCNDFFDCDNSKLSTEQGLRAAMTKSDAGCAAHRVIDVNQVKRLKNGSIQSVQSFAAVAIGDTITDFTAYLAANPDLVLVHQSAYYDGSKHTIIATFSSL